MSARRQTPARSRVREWQTVTVALAFRSRLASGLPTRIERPTTTASAPSGSTPAWRSSSITPCGVHGTRPGRPWASRPALAGGQPVDVLGRVDRARSPRPGRSGPGSGSWTRIPSTSSSAFSSPTSASSSSWEVEASSPWWTERIPTSSVCFRLLRDVDLGGGVVADEHGRQARGAAAVRGRELLHLAAHPLAHLGRHRLAVDHPRARSGARPRQGSDLLQRRVVGHQLALGGVGGEADDDHPARLDRR